MCEAVQQMISQGRDGAASKKRKDALLIADRDDKMRPVGIGGRRREEDIMAIVDGMQSGLSIPTKN